MKSFSAITKEELCKSVNETDCCDRAELSGMILFGGTLCGRNIRFVTESRDVFSRFEFLCKKLGASAEGKKSSARLVATLSLDEKTLGAFDWDTVPDAIKTMPCCIRAFVKGAFLGGGTIIDPNKNYNLEVVAPNKSLCREFGKLLLEEGFEFKIATRKTRYVLYTKKSEEIEDFLSYIGAYQAQMELINIKIEKGIRNDFNRTANSEGANFDKVIEASISQIQAIEVLTEKEGIGSLPEDLQEVARLRLDNRSASLAEIGRLLNPPLGKSSVNRRFQKIIQLADKLKHNEKR